MNLNLLGGRPQTKERSPRLAASRSILATQRAVLMAAMLLTLVAARKTDAEPGQADIPAGLQCLVEAYPDHLAGAEGNTLIWRDGTRMQYDDGRFKTAAEVLTDSDLEDQMAQRYMEGEGYLPILNGYDPGRARYEQFFRKMYGETQGEVKPHLTPVSWFGETLQVTNINGVDEKLQAAANELKLLTQSRPDLKPFLEGSGGTFNWRVIAGTERLSTHSFGIAIDINVAHGNYWRWSKTGAEPYTNRVPMEIVEVFEKHGFIWGGKWYHYDTMHFEYRPELLEEECVISSSL